MSSTTANQYQDQEITCYCGETFVFTAGEQEFYESKGMVPPKRCQSCRAEKKRRQQEQEGGGRFKRK